HLALLADDQRRLVASADTGFAVGDLAGDIGADPIAPFAARSQREGWSYRELVASHDPQLTDPAGTAAVLDELAASA
ncbi:MAG: hypothetical protein LC777_05260, partial [Actinobacteria bacterium]|nr:hypothetical protein [Actinomycetota bacterium]